MGLPQLQYATFETTLVSSKTPIRFRPFLSKEEKILLIALTGGDKDEMTKALKQVVSNCVLNEGFDVNRLPSFDLEYLFTVIRAKSVGDTVVLRFKGRENTECKECAKEREVTVDLNKVKVVADPNHTNKIELTDKIGVVMKYPTPDQLLDLMTVRTSFDVNLQFTLISDCIEFIYDPENTYEIGAQNKDEAVKWLESLSPSHFAKVFKFFDTMPTLRHTVDLSCGKCGFKEEFVVEGIEGFFM